MEVLQQEIVKLVAKGAMTAGEIRNRLNGQPLGLDVSLDDVLDACGGLRAISLLSVCGELVRTPINAGCREAYERGQLFALHSDTQVFAQDAQLNGRGARASKSRVYREI